MKHWFRSKGVGWIAFLGIAGLVGGGLGWATVAALDLEQKQQEAQAQEQLYGQLRLAMWRLDGRIAPVLAKEDSRPYNQYSAVFAPPLVLTNRGEFCAPGTVLEPSPLLNVALPDWIVLHFQTDSKSVWTSPQVMSNELVEQLLNKKDKVPRANCTSQRQALLVELKQSLKPQELLAEVKLRADVDPNLLTDETLVVASNNDRSKNPIDGNKDPKSQQDGNPAVQPAQPTPQGVDNSAAGQQQALNYSDFQRRSYVQNQVKQEVQSSKSPVFDPNAYGNTMRNGADWFSPGGTKVFRSEAAAIGVGAMVPIWLNCGDRERLVVARLVRVGEKEFCQGMVLDWPMLQEMLTTEVSDLFPEATVAPMRDREPTHPERTMTALPVALDPGPADSTPTETWTPLRVGLAFAWAAAIVALLAVGLGGWSLIELSERRIRFVSAVTHELRTPMTTLRLYLDMLTGGMVRDEKQKEEYLRTLNAESDRLNRLVGNVLDFSRLENQKPRLAISTIPVAELLEQLQSTWQGRCQDADKELIVENKAGEAAVATDIGLVQQVLGNLIDNAIKYSRGADDPRIWLRACTEGGRLHLEVEDRGPGVPQAERRSIFRPFRRGRSADVTAGGVGLGLALARRWARLLGGRLSLQPDCAGACFRLDLPC